jgi:WD40 repeat protein
MNATLRRIACVGILILAESVRGGANTGARSGVAPGPVFSPRFSYDGRRVLAVPYPSKTAVLWDLENGEQLLVLRGHTELIVAAVLSPDGKSALTGGGRSVQHADNSARLWDLATGRETTRFETRSSLEIVQFSPDGNRVLTSGADGVTRVWDPKTGHQLFVCSNAAFCSSPRGYFQFSPDSACVVGIAESGSQVRIWDASSGAEVYRRSRPKGIFDYRWVEFSPDGKLVVAAGYKGPTSVCAVGGDYRSWEVGGGRDGLVQASFLPDSATIVTVSSLSSGGSVRFWESQTGRGERTLSSKQRVESVLTSRDGKRLLAKNRGEGFALWDLEKNRQIRTWPGGSGTDVIGFSPDGERLLTWDLAAERPLHVLHASTGETYRNLKP